MFRFTGKSILWSVLLTITACSGSEDSAIDAQQAVIEFSDLRIEELAPNRAVLRFDTDVPASCEAQYGLAADQLEYAATDPEMEPGELMITHQVPLEDLSPETTYYVRARATDENDRTEYSDIIEFTTPAGDDPSASLVNVALLEEGTTVVEVSSNFGGEDNDSAYGISRALDGKVATEWSTARDGDDAYVVLDFGQTRTITHFAYRSRMMVDGTSIVTRVRVLVEGTDIVLGPFDTPDHTRRYVFELTEPVDASRVRFEAVATTGGNTGGKEIQFFSAP